MDVGLQMFVCIRVRVKAGWVDTNERWYLIHGWLYINICAFVNIHFIIVFVHVCIHVYNVNTYIVSSFSLLVHQQC